MDKEIKPIISFEKEIGNQIRKNKRPEFTIPNKFKGLLEMYNEFPQKYSVIINDIELEGALYKNSRPYYYFHIQKENINVFWELIDEKKFFLVEVNLIDKIVRIN